MDFESRDAIACNIVDATRIGLVHGDALANGTAIFMQRLLDDLPPR